MCEYQPEESRLCLAPTRAAGRAPRGSDGAAFLVDAVVVPAALAVALAQRLHVPGRLHPAEGLDGDLDQLDQLETP